MSFGKLGSLGKGFGRLGSGGKPAVSGPPPGPGGVGSPIGLLLVLTKSS